MAWRDLPPILDPAPAKAIIPPLPRHAHLCDGPTRRFVRAGHQGLNSLTTIYYFEVRNRGQTTCALTGRPTVSILKTGSHAIRVGSMPGTYGEVSLAGRTFGLAPGRTASVELFVSNQCADVYARKTQAVVVLEAVGRRLRVTLETCRPGLDLDLTPFQPVVKLPPDPRTTFPFRASIVGEPHGRRGTTLVYRVRLRNVSSDPFTFPWCPRLNEWIGHQNGPSFTLNCRPAGTIAPGGSVSFVMHYRLSPHYLPGLRTLHWTLSTETDQPQPGTKAALRIDP